MEASELNDVKSRAYKYIWNMKKALETLRITSSQHKDVDGVLKLAMMYLKDAEYYFGLGDYITSIADSSYAEGLLDALRLLGLASLQWPKEKPKKVLVAGTFDIVHYGHLELLSYAAGLGKVYVVVSRDANASTLKGRELVFPEDERLYIVKNLKPVYEAVLGDEQDFSAPVKQIDPDIIILGPDQKLPRAVEDYARRRGISLVRVNERYCKPGWICSSTNALLRAHEIVRRRGLME